MGKIIAVCIKPVPDPRYYERVAIDPITKTLIRQGIPTVINPVDKNAIEAAIRLKETYGGKVVLVTMAPPDTIENIREGLAMGADEAFLLSDRAFAGSDTLATSLVLAAGINKIAPVDLIITGNESADGGTNHIPSQLGEVLGVPHLTNVRDIHWDGSGPMLLQVKIENGYLEVTANLPMVLGVTRDVNTPRYTTLMGVVAAQSKPIKIWTSQDLDLDLQSVGLKGSPTQPGELRVPDLGRKTEMLHGDMEEMAQKLVSIIRATGALG